MLRHKHQFLLRNGLPYKEIQFCSCEKPSVQLVLPQNHRQQAMRAFHDDIGHLRLERPVDFL